MTRVQTLSLAIGVALAALAVGWMAGRATNDAPSAATSAEAPAAERKVLYYRNPMGLPDTSPVPKKDPMGMDYIPVYAGDAPAAAPGTVVMPPDKVQALGVRTEAVQRAVLAATVRTSGTVEVDETRQYAIAPRFVGWVERLYADQTGMRVRAGQPLLSVYSPQLAAAQQEYRLADETARRLAGSDPASAASMTRLRDAGAASKGIVLLNQAVLLRGVNDSVDALADLCERGHAAGVLPYYLHQLDRVAGAAHFEVDDARALALHAALSARLPGYLVPRLVREVAGQPGKTPLIAIAGSIVAAE